ncbi:hypothetical protein [Kitasatospora sp. NPDC101183]|uniref:hypothetical protein n=1 Tax=Kitasatospora sp. NPDC101183 TaxID=3364100 RepID=UPI00381AF09D
MSLKKSSSRLSGVLVAACVAATTVLAAAPAHADSIQAGGSLSSSSTGSLGNNAAPGGTVTRSQVLARAQAWVNQSVPYSTNGLNSPYSWWSDSQTGGRYRQDCSGFVSMAWELTSSPTTLDLPAYSNKISAPDLQPGDILDSDQHVIIFESWRDKAAGTFNYYQESSRSRPTNYNSDGNLNASSLAGHPTSSYTAYRYKNIVDDGPSVPGQGPGNTLSASASGNQVHLSMIGSDGQLWVTEGDYSAGTWSTNWTPMGGSGLKALTSTMTGNTEQLFAIGSTGHIYTKGADYTAGKWSGDWVEVPGGAAGATAITASATGNKVHLNILDTAGQLWVTDADYTAGTWSTNWTPMGGSGLKALTSVMTGNTMQLYAVGSTGHIYTKAADYTAGKWSGDWVEVPGGAAGATAITASATGNKVHLNILDTAGQLWVTDADYTAGTWSTNWTPMGGSGLKSLTSTMTNNTMQIYVTAANSHAFNKGADYTAGKWSDGWNEVPGGAVSAN